MIGLSTLANAMPIARDLRLFALVEKPSRPVAPTEVLASIDQNVLQLHLRVLLAQPGGYLPP